MSEVQIGKGSSRTDEVRLQEGDPRGPEASPVSEGDAKPVPSTSAEQNPETVCRDDRTDEADSLGGVSECSDVENTEGSQSAAEATEPDCGAAGEEDSEIPRTDDPEGSECQPTDIDEADPAEMDQETSSMFPPKPEKLGIDLTAGQLIKLLKKVGKAEFFHDEHGIAFGWVPAVDGSTHYECLPLTSRAFRARIMQLAEAYAVNTPTAKVISETIELAKLNAFREPQRELANRHTAMNGQIKIDLGDPEWKQVEVTKDGYTVGPQSEPRFYRPQHMKALPEPVTGGNPYDLFEYVSVDSEDDKLLILCWVVSALYPDVASPILALTGVQGSAKTTRSRQLRELTDPSVTPVLGDIERGNLFLTFQQHAVPCFENVSKFARREADMFCRAVTGNGVERRKLFTNSDQVLYSFRRPIIINGIDLPSTRPDFLDRCVVINCRRIASFRPLRELDEEFRDAKPRLFGSLLQLLADTLNQLPVTPSDSEFRMADFAHFGRAMAIALGKTAEDFDKAYRANIRQQDQEALDATPMVNAVKSFASNFSAAKPWEGPAKQLLDGLRQTVHRNGDRDARSDLPKNARWLSSRLSELASALKTAGVIVDQLPRTSSSRGWRVFMTDEDRKERERFHATPEGASEALDEADLFVNLVSDEE